ncbi:MAG: Na+:solute symporter [Myxococcales bacterium]|nr:Na+:solute symporter [Myxococcales bacterium]
MTVLDWSIVSVFLLASLWIGVLFTRRAGKNTSEFFLSGRSLPWWALGTSMVATTFAADTPLAVTEYVRKDGIWANWFWWTLAIGHVLSALVFSRLWRRAGVLTDNELIELRYDGRAAAFLRGFKAIYFSTVYNFIVMGWVTAAMSTVFSAFLDIPIAWSVVISLTVAGVYSLLSGLWGVVATDIFQFLVAMVGSVAFAIIASARAGGMESLVENLNANGFTERLRMLPSMSAGSEVWLTFLVYVGIMWWANHGADGGGYIIQRMLAAKDEKHALIGTSWFALAHYVLRMWPWIVVALASLVLLPKLTAHPETISDRQAYPALMAALLPSGWRGVFVAVFLAAYMSTMVTHINWGASYMVHDVYRRFMCPDADEKKLVRLSRVLSVANLLLGGLIALFIERITAAWELVWAMGAGLGLVLILRWFWWRINAWSEIFAMATSFAITAGIFVYDIVAKAQTPLYLKAVIVVFGSMVVMLTATLLSKPVSREKLEAFYRRVRPGGFWPFSGGGFGHRLWIAWLGGVLAIYCMMFLLGSLVLRDFEAVVWQGALLSVGVLMLYWGLRRYSFS